MNRQFGGDGEHSECVDEQLEGVAQHLRGGGVAYLNTTVFYVYTNTTVLYVYVVVYLNTTVVYVYTTTVHVYNTGCILIGRVVAVVILI